LIERLKKDNPEAPPAESVFKLQDPKKSLASACKRLKLPSFSQRSLRRMFIIEALNKGVPVKTISKWQGHQDGGVLILKTYSEVIDQKANQEAANLLA
jgi:integrase